MRLEDFRPKVRNVDGGDYYNEAATLIGQLPHWHNVSADYQQVGVQSEGWTETPVHVLSDLK